jgi:hypothetical protein
MTNDSNLFHLVRDGLPARLDAGQTARLLGIAPHDVPVLTGTGLLKPLGSPVQPMRQSISHWLMFWSTPPTVIGLIGQPRRWPNTGGLRTTRNAPKRASRIVNGSIRRLRQLRDTGSVKTMCNVQKELGKKCQ